MPRVTKVLADERENYMLAVFKQEPYLSIAKANEKLKKQYGGKMMRAARAYELRGIARKENADAGVVIQKPRAGVAPPVQALRKVNGGKKPKRVQEAARKVNPPAAKPPPPAPGKSGGGKVVILQGTEDQMAFLQSTIDTLRSVGMCNLKVDHSTPTYAVVRS